MQTERLEETATSSRQIFNNMRLHTNSTQCTSFSESGTMVHDNNISDNRAQHWLEWLAVFPYNTLVDKLAFKTTGSTLQSGDSSSAKVKPHVRFATSDPDMAALTWFIHTNKQNIQLLQVPIQKINATDIPQGMFIWEWGFNRSKTH